MPDHHPFRPSNGGYSLRGCARREVPPSWWCGHLWGHEKSGCAVGAVPPSWFRRRSCRICRARPWVSNPCLVLHNGCRSCRIGMDHEWLTLLLTFTQHSPTPYATHTVTPRTQVHHHHLTPTPETPHPHHTPPTPRTRIHRTPRQQRTPEAPSRQPPPTPITTPTKNLTHHPPTGTDQRSTHHSTTPYVMPTSTHPRGTLHVPQSTLTPCTYTTSETHTQNPPSAPTTTNQTTVQHPTPRAHRTLRTPRPHRQQSTLLPHTETTSTTRGTPQGSHDTDLTDTDTGIPTHPPAGPRRTGNAWTQARRVDHHARTAHRTPQKGRPSTRGTTNATCRSTPRGSSPRDEGPHLQHQEPPASSTATTTGPSTPQAPTINACYYLHLEPLWLPGEGFEHTARSLRPPGVTPVTVTPVTLHALTHLSACLSAGMVVDWGRAQS